MRINLLILIIAISSGKVLAQREVLEEIKASVTKKEAKAHLTFLASDEMRGRGTGTAEITLAANYLAGQFKKYGLKTIEGAPDYFQAVRMTKTFHPNVNFKLGNTTFKYKDDLVLLKGNGSISETKVVFVGYGNEIDFNTLNVEGKIVVALTGTSENTSPRVGYREDSPAKLKRVIGKGGVALVEIEVFKEIAWQEITFPELSSEFDVITLQGDFHETNSIPHLWMDMSENEDLIKLMNDKEAIGSLTVERQPKIKFSDNNVIGLIEGSDLKLKKEHVILSAHYDHIGVIKNDTPDSIYNGARDNAIGITAILQAASFLAKNPPKRSIIILAFCAEEIDLLGSKWYTEHPLIPLNRTVFNFNCDGAGYNSKKLITLIDLNRTNADNHIRKGGKAFGLKLRGDPDPEEELYNGSDNFNFALKGVPAIDIAPGVKSFDEELLQYYHQPSDEVSSLDFEYLEKFFRAYAYSAYLIANSSQRPYWKSGDEFEEVGKLLYESK